MTPQRIQLRRTKGWRKPEGAVNVARPSRWGNPFSVEKHGRDVAVLLYRSVLFGFWNPSVLDDLTDEEYRVVADQRETFVRRVGGHPADVARSELAGRDLACWCALDQKCHADVLLAAANK